MVSLPQINDFSENLGLSCPGAMDRPTRTVQEAGLARLDISFLPPIKGTTANPKISAGLRNVMSHFLEVMNDT
jgi:hypothetical protein